MEKRIKGLDLLRGSFFLFFLFLGLGQLGRIPWLSKEIGLYLADIFLVLSLGLYFFYLFRRGEKLPSLALSRPILIFFLWGLASLVFSLRLFTVPEILVGGLYLIRWGAYASVYLLSFGVTRRLDKKFIPRVLILAGVIITLWGFVQLWLWPDFSFMASLGWDPHYYRFLSTFFDPNFCGGFLVLILSLLVSYYLFDRQKSLLLFSLVVYSALVLTYSRSAYVAFLLSMLVIGLLKEKKVFLVALVAFLFCFQFNPRVRTRMEGAIAVDESASHRLTSWEAALIVIQKHPMFGVGLNNYRLAQVKYGLVDPIERGGHAGAGADSSFLFILATTGIFGLLISFWLGGKAARLAFLKTRTNPLALTFLASLVALAFHSQFVNSFFFPPIMAFLWAILGAFEANGKVVPRSFQD